MTLSEFLSEQAISQAHFAGVIGVSAASVSRYLNGLQAPSAAMMLRIREATGGRVTPNDLLCCEGVE